ncbi:MAG: DUF1272 domain-containing protein [Betaproteobacteria bacterium]|nr:DUF1272 domain-containing protein [Betaproteobacteria bacterium]
MLQFQPNCECCHKDFQANSTEAGICFFECTFCADCRDGGLFGKCPNSGGEQVAHPQRTAEKLINHPAPTKRIYKPMNYARTA